MGVQLRALGTTATYAPVMKRGAHRLSTGASVVVAPDTNRSDANGADVTGTAKIYIYLSTDANRTAYTLQQSHTPAVACSSSTIAFVGSSTLRENNDLFVVYQGTDNSLRMITFTWSGSAYNAGTEQTIIAANSVTTRFRAVDVDALGTNSSIGVLVYEANASTGQGAYVRAYVRLTDNTTWIKAFEHQIFTTEFIKSGSEDVSIAWDRIGIQSNVGKMVIYYTQNHTTADNGDYLRELSFNCSTGTTNSATALGAWFTNLNQNLAAGTRRGYVFPEASGKYVFGTAIGSTIPRFQAMRLVAGTYTGLVINQTNVTINQLRRIIIRRDNNTATAVTADFCDGRIVFCYSGFGLTTSNYQMRTLVIRFDETDLAKMSATVDVDARVSDGGYNLADGVIGVYGGGTKNNTSSLFEWNFGAIYGSAGNSVSNVAEVLPRKFRAFTEDAYTAPTLIAPLSNPGVNKPTLRAEFKNGSLYSNLLGKMHWQLASDFAYSTNIRNVIESDTEYRSFSTTDGSTTPTRPISMDWPASVTALFGGTWYIRCRVMDDLGGVSPWSVDDSFNLSHPPTALPLSPAANSTVPYTTGDTLFSWTFSDTESTDSQTAYQVVIVRVDTGATVLDTGKVVSSVNNTWIDLAGTLRGLPLQWQVSLWDQNDTQGPFSSARQFTLLDKPLVSITAPVDSTTVTTAMPTVTWAFSADAGRTQRAYRVTIYWTNPNPIELVGDSGWVISSATSHTFSANVLANSQNYRFIVDVQDSTGMYSSTSDNIVANPSFEADTRGWTVTGGAISRSTAFKHDGVASLFVDPTGGSACQATEDFVPCKVGLTYEASMWIYMPTGYSGTVNLKIIRYNSSGTPTGTTTVGFTPITSATWTQLTGSVATVSGDAYIAVAVEIAGTPVTSDFLYLDQVSLIQHQVACPTSWTPPALGNGSLTQNDFKVTISWTNANLDANFVSWRVYRRYMKVADSAIDFNNTANIWVLIYETTNNGASVSYDDYTAPLNRSVQYVVVQLADRFGSMIESNISSFQTINTLGDRYFFVPQTPIGSVASFEASNVNADNFVREVEQEKLHIIGRGRQVQVGDDLGYDGALTIRLRNVLTSRRDREWFEYLSTQDAPNTFIKSPFGDVFLVKIGPISSARVPGVGATDMVDLTVPYSQAFEDVPVTRMT